MRRETPGITRPQPDASSIRRAASGKRVALQLCADRRLDTQTHRHRHTRTHRHTHTQTHTHTDTHTHTHTDTHTHARSLVYTLSDSHLFSMKWCRRHDLPVLALPITRNLNKKSGCRRGRARCESGTKASAVIRNSHASPYDSDMSLCGVLCGWGRRVLCGCAGAGDCASLFSREGWGDLG